MNSICKCPKCNRYTENTLDKENVLINCQLGYHSTIEINQHNNTINNDNINAITNDLKKFNEHLLTNFKTSKNYNREEINIEEVKTTTEHTKSVNFLLHLRNGRVASCSDDKKIRIFDKVIKRDSNDIIMSVR